jgi:hypothetical protein
MSVKSQLLEHLAACEKIARDGQEVIPAWRIAGAEAEFVVITRFDHDKPEQVERLMLLMKRFMVWKLATHFIIGMEAWLGAEKTREGDEAIFAIAVSREEPMGAMKRILRNGVAVEFGPLEWLAAEQIDRTFFELLPGRAEVLQPGEAEALEAIFGENGELPAVRLS